MTQLNLFELGKPGRSRRSGCSPGRTATFWREIEKRLLRLASHEIVNANGGNASPIVLTDVGLPFDTVFGLVTTGWWWTTSPSGQPFLDKAGPLLCTRDELRRMLKSFCFDLRSGDRVFPRQDVLAA